MGAKTANSSEGHKQQITNNELHNQTKSGGGGSTDFDNKKKDDKSKVTEHKYKELKDRKKKEDDDDDDNKDKGGPGGKPTPPKEDSPSKDKDDKPEFERPDDSKPGGDIVPDGGDGDDVDDDPDGVAEQLLDDDEPEESSTPAEPPTPDEQEKAVQKDEDNGSSGGGGETKNTNVSVGIGDPGQSSAAGTSRNTDAASADAFAGLGDNGPKPFTIPTKQEEPEATPPLPPPDDPAAPEDPETPDEPAEDEECPLMEKLIEYTHNLDPNEQHRLYLYFYPEDTEESKTSQSEAMNGDTTIKPMPPGTPTPKYIRVQIQQMQQKQVNPKTGQMEACYMLSAFIGRNNLLEVQRISGGKVQMEEPTNAENALLYFPGLSSLKYIKYDERPKGASKDKVYFFRSQKPSDLSSLTDIKPDPTLVMAGMKVQGAATPKIIPSSVAVTEDLQPVLKKGQGEEAEAAPEAALEAAPEQPGGMEEQNTVEPAVEPPPQELVQAPTDDGSDKKIKRKIKRPSKDKMDITDILMKRGM